MKNHGNRPAFGIVCNVHSDGIYVRFGEAVHVFQFQIAELFTMPKDVRYACVRNGVPTQPMTIL
jgi:hypothetical protein